MNPSAVLFDLGDTLLDFEPMDSSSVFEKAGIQTYAYLQSLGHRLPPLRVYVRRQYRQLCLAYIWSKLRGREFNSFDLLRKSCRQMKLQLDEAGLRELAWMWYRPVTRHASVAPDVIPALEVLRARGYRLAIVSNTFIPGFVLDRHLESHNLLEYFPVRVYSSEVGYRKPHRRIFQIALEALGVSCRDAVFVGDTIKKDMLGARRAGMRTILRAPFGAARGHPLADLVIRHIHELPRVIPALDTATPGKAVPAEELAYET